MINAALNLSVFLGGPGNFSHQELKNKQKNLQTKEGTIDIVYTLSFYILNIIHHQRNKKYPLKKKSHGVTNQQATPPPLHHKQYTTLTIFSNPKSSKLTGWPLFKHTGRDLVIRQTSLGISELLGWTSRLATPAMRDAGFSIKTSKV